MKRFSDLVISQSCIYRITQNRASNYLTHARWRVPSIHCVGHRRGQYSTSASSTSPVARSSRCSVVDIEEKDNWFGSAISFARSSRYVSRYVSSNVVRRDGGAMAIPSRFNIREKRTGRLLTDDWYAIPSGVFIFVFPSAYLFCKIIEIICVCHTTVYNHREKRKRMTGSLRCATARICIEFTFCSISFCCYINC